MIGNEQNCLPVVLKYEGGWTNDPRDPGGATMKGVTQRVYDAFRKRTGHPQQTVRAISPDEVEIIYRNEYWAPIGGDDLPAGVDFCAFDASVNSGPAQALTWLKRAPSAPPVKTIRSICDQRLSFMHAIRHGSLWKVFGSGWGERVADVEARSLKMAVAKSPAPIAQLSLEAKVSNDKAGNTRAVMAAPAASAAGVTVAPDSVPWWLLVILLALTIGTAVLIWLKARQHTQRADAIKTVAESL